MNEKRDTDYKTAMDHLLYAIKSNESVIGADIPRWHEVLVMIGANIQRMKEVLNKAELILDVVQTDNDYRIVCKHRDGYMNEVYVDFTSDKRTILFTGIIDERFRITNRIEQDIVEVCDSMISGFAYDYARLLQDEIDAYEEHEREGKDPNLG